MAVPVARSRSAFVRVRRCVHCKKRRKRHHRGPAGVQSARGRPLGERPGRQGFVVWFTGLSGSGKSTLAEQLAPVLRERGMDVEVLDGDEVRTHLSKGLGFSKEDRDTNILRIGYVAKLLARNGVAVITAAISPYSETRDEVRGWVDHFVEVHVDCSLDELVRRDVKGLYKKAIAGEIDHFTGVSDPYEAPLRPEVRVDSETQSVEQSLAAILDDLKQRQLIPEPADA